jgi:CRP/FNR family transcriptional regulator, cyclic AMP receptor protein
MTGARVPVLDLDPGLGEAIPPEHLERARLEVRAGVRNRPIGPWDAIGEYGECSRWFGLLLIDGFVARETSCAGQTVTEIVGPGDLMRPWDHDREFPIEEIRTGWRMLEPGRIALLDEEFTRALAAWPALTVVLLARIARRARWLGMRLTVMQVHGVACRVLHMLWLLAERWGREVPEGVNIPVRLTHEQLAELIGAQRPSVSHAVSELRPAGVLSLGADGWLIPADTPALLDHLERERSASTV